MINRELQAALAKYPPDMDVQMDSMYNGPAEIGMVVSSDEIYRYQEAGPVYPVPFVVIHS